jgi:hypothetical protein
MANHLSMANLQAIAALHRSGHSNRHIARVLGVNRETVGKYFSELQNQPNSQTGSGDPPPGPATISNAGPVSSCEPFREQIIAWLEAGLSIKRIHQDLTYEHGCTGTYCKGAIQYLIVSCSKTDRNTRPIATPNASLLGARKTKTPRASYRKPA